MVYILYDALRYTNTQIYPAMVMVHRWTLTAGALAVVKDVLRPYGWPGNLNVIPTYFPLICPTAQAAIGGKANLGS